MRTKRFRECINSYSYVDCVEVYVDDPVQCIEFEDPYMSLVKVLQSHISEKRMPVLGCRLTDIDERNIQHHLRLAQMLNIPLYLHIRKNYEQTAKFVERTIFSNTSLSVPYKLLRETSAIL